MNHYVYTGQRPLSVEGSTFTTGDGITSLIKTSACANRNIVVPVETIVSWFPKIEADLYDQPILPFSLTKWSNIIYGGRWWDFQDIKLRFMSGGPHQPYNPIIWPIFWILMPFSENIHINGYFDKTLTWIILMILNEILDRYHDQNLHFKELNFIEVCRKVTTFGQTSF